MEGLKERIKKIRKALKLNQFEFANKLNVTQAFISQLETGKHGATKAFLTKISYIFSVRPDYLKDGSLPIFFESETEKDNFIRTLGFGAFNIAVTAGESALKEISNYVTDYGMNFFDRTTSAKELVKWANFFDTIGFIVDSDKKGGRVYHDVGDIIGEALRHWKRDNEQTYYYTEE
jgi:transcriptional regulator with XRE-family HTH domain